MQFLTLHWSVDFLADKEAAVAKRWSNLESNLAISLSLQKLHLFEFLEQRELLV